VLGLSSSTWEHPKQLLESRFDKSTIRLFNDAFEESRLNSLIQNPRLDKIYAFVIMFYNVVIGVFWILVFAGVFYSHLFWKQSYFLIGTCLVSVFIFSLFFSGANRLFVPILPCLYIIMGVGVLFLYRLPLLGRGEIKTLLWRNGLLVILLLAAFLCRGLFICYPAEKGETIEELRRWNVISMGDESVRLIIMASQLAYPVQRDSFIRDAFSVWLGEKEIPHISQAGKTPSDEKFYFKDVKDQLCRDAFVINVPHALMNSFVSEPKQGDGKVTGKEIVNSLKGKIRVRYVPAWQFRSWLETGINALLKHLKGRQAQSYENTISGNLSTILLRLRTV